MYLSDINISFNNKNIFDHADFHAVRGRVNIIWGESGSGKSTLIQALLFRHPCKYVYDGIEISDFSEEERSSFLFEKVSCVYQEPLLIDYLSINDNIKFKVLICTALVNTANKGIINSFRKGNT